MRPRCAAGPFIVPKAAYRHCYENSLQRPLLRLSGGGRNPGERGPVPPFSSLVVPVATGIGDCYENRSMSQATELPRTEVRGLQTRQTGGFSPRDIYARGEAYRLPQDASIFIPLCGLRKATVFPAQAGIQVGLGACSTPGRPTLKRPWLCSATSCISESWRGCAP